MATPTNLPASATAGQVLSAQYVNDLRGAFRVLQVVHATYGTAAGNSTTSFVDTGLTATITPQATSNKILVIVNQMGVAKLAGNAASAVAIRIMRGATEVYQTNGLMYTNSSLANYGSCAMTIFDTPNTTSAVTYKTQFANNVNASDAQVQASIGAGFQTSTITLMEISL
jgi:hypothetical protein